MAIRGGPAGAQGFPGPRGAGRVGPEGPAVDPGISVVDNQNGSFTLTIDNPYYYNQITWYNGASGEAPVKGVDYFDGATGDYISYVYGQVPAGDPVPSVNQGTGTFDGTIEIPPTGSVSWTDDPNFTEGQDTYMTRNRYTHDPSKVGVAAWTQVGNWTTPTIFKKTDQYSQNRLTSYVFSRTTLIRPDAGTGDFANPLPDPMGQWSDGIPAGTAPIYFSKRLFTSDGLTPQEAQWSDPALLLQNGTGIRLEFAPFNKSGWSITPNADDYWMATCTQDINGSWVCDYVNAVRIKGEDGDAGNSMFRAFAFKRSVTPLSERPTGGNFLLPYPVDGVVSGWTDTIPAGDGNLYMSSRLFTADGTSPQEVEWSESSLFSGDGAIQFRIEQDSYFFRFDKDNTNPYPTAISFTAFAQNIGFTPDWEVYAEDGSTVIATSATKLDVDTFSITATEFGVNNEVTIVATAGLYSDQVKVLRIQDGLQGPAGVATEVREVRFQYAPDVGGSPGVWHDKPFLVNDVWMREGTFYDGVLQGSWSAGTQIVGDDGALTYTEFWFSPDGVDTPDDNPPSGTTNGDWSQAQRAGDFWVIARTTTSGITGSWGTAVLIRGDDGVNGKYFETQFAVADKASQPQIDLSSPVAPDYDNTVDNPTGWTTNPALVTSNDEVIWAISCTKLHDGTLDVNWSAAVQWGAYTPTKGNDYTDGLGGVHVSTMFISAPDGDDNGQPDNGIDPWTNLALPSGGVYGPNPGNSNIIEEYNVTTNSWVDDPMSPGTGEFVWMTKQIYTPSIQGDGTNSWIASGWSTPVKFAYIPTFGTDYFNGNTGLTGEGQFTSYVFRNETVGTTPSAPPNTGTDAEQGAYDPLGVGETIPNNWTDDPTSPADDTVLTWASQRIYVKAAGSTTWVGGNWTTPVLFSGTPTFTGALENIGGSIKADAGGTGYDLTGYGGTFNCEYGGTPLLSNVSFSVTNGSVDGSFHSYTNADGLTMKINLTTGEYILEAPSNSWTGNQATFILNATYALTSVVVSRRYTIVKVTDGIDGAEGTSSRLDIAYADNNTGSNVVYPSGRLTNGAGQGSDVYTAAVRGTRRWQGTNVVTWIEPASTNEPESNPADNGLSTPDAEDYTAYEWTEIEPENGLSNRVDIAYSDAADGDSVGSAFPSGSLDTTYVKAAYNPTTHIYMGTNVVTWTEGVETEPLAQSFPYSSYEWARIKGNDGDPGDPGDPGAAGADSVHGLLTNESHAIPVDINGNNPVFTNSGTSFYVYEGGVLLNRVSSSPANGEFYVSSINDVDCTADNTPSGVNYADFSAITAIAADMASITYTATGKTSNGVDFSIIKTMTLYKAYPGADGQEGNDGSDAITCLLSKDSHGVPTDSDGNTPVFTNSGVVLSVYEGSTKLAHNGVGTSPSTWKVTAAGSSVTPGSITDSGSDAVMGNISGISADTGKITFTLTGETADGTPFSFTKVMTFSKVKDAAETLPDTDGESGGMGDTLVGHVSSGGQIQVGWNASASNLSDTVDRNGSAEGTTLAYQLNGGSWITIDSDNSSIVSLDEGSSYISSVSFFGSVTHTPGSGTINYRVASAPGWANTDYANINIEEFPSA